MSEYHRLTDQKYSETEYLFQTIEMAKSDEEFDVELCSSPPSQTKLDLELMGSDPQSIYSWKVVKRRRARRRYTVSHCGGGGSGGGKQNGVQGNGSSANCMPPAPPSTPTSLTPTNSSLLSSSNGSNMSSSFMANDLAEQQRLGKLLFMQCDYAPKYKKKLKEQQRTDAELADLFNVVSITATSNGSSSTSKMKVQPERGVSSASRTIRKHDSCITNISKLRRNLMEKEFFREPEEEDSVSAPEYDTEEEDTRFHRLGRIKPSRKLLQSKRERRFARFELQERMEAMVDTFDEAMTFNET